MIKKAVIPCGGKGTRFLPITKAVPKEMLPIIDKPCLAYIVDELIESGITEILIVSSPEKTEIEKYFKFDSALEDFLISTGKEAEAEMLRKIHENADVRFTYQVKPKGSGDAIYRAKDFIGKEAFVIALGDDLMYSEVPVSKQLVSAYEHANGSVIGVQRLDDDSIVNYGVAETEFSDGALHKIRRLVEKPSLDRLPSRLACLGRYVVTSKIFNKLETQTPDKKGEIQLTDALNKLSADGLYAYEFEGRRYDMGDKFGAVTATVEYSLRGAFGDRFKRYLIELSKNLTED